MEIRRTARAPKPRTWFGDAPPVAARPAKRKAARAPYFIRHPNVPLTLPPTRRRQAARAGSAGAAGRGTVARARDAPSEHPEGWRWTPPPTLEGDEWRWPELEMRQGPRGWGVFARVALAAGVLIPYGAAVITMNRRIKLKKDSWVLEFDTHHALDGNPELFRCAGEHAVVGALLNEASGEQRTTCRFYALNADEQAFRPPPVYPVFTRCQAVEVMVPVQAGEELFVSYGYGEKYKTRRTYQSVHDVLGRAEGWGAHRSAAERAAFADEARAKQAALDAARAELERPKMSRSDAGTRGNEEKRRKSAAKAAGRFGTRVALLTVV